jgi:hypothetical protein
MKKLPLVHDVSGAPQVQVLDVGPIDDSLEARGWAAATD